MLGQATPLRASTGCKPGHRLAYTLIVSFAVLSEAEVRVRVSASPAVELDAALAGLPSTHLSDDAAWASHSLLFTELRSRNTSRALPHFYVLGAAKAGSTDLYAHICEHPRVDCSGPKERRVWTAYLKHVHQAYRHPSSLQRVLPALIHQLTQPVEAPRSVFGDATPEYLNGWLMDDNWDRSRFASAWRQNTTVVRACLPHVIKLAHPQGVPLIAILREPVQRSWSHYRYIFGDIMHQHPSEADFDALVHAELRSYLLCERDHGLRCAFGLANGYSHATRYAAGSGKLGLHVGMYAAHLQVWRSYHGELVLPLCFDDLISKPAAVLQRVYRHLGLVTKDARVAHQATQWQPRNPTTAGTGLAMLNRTADQLHAFYAPHNNMLRWLMPKMGVAACGWALPQPVQRARC
tara:strand:- start:184 stop:1404 length:1221 start_codon:yes stop_codon:yes gene_type:complete